MATSEEMQTITDQLNTVVIAAQVDNNEYYYIGDLPTFYNAVAAFEALTASETDANYSEYLDLEIYIGKVLAMFKDQPSTRTGVKLVNYNNSLNTITVAEQNWQIDDAINELYLINSVNTDFEIYSSGYILLPSQS